MLRVLSFFTLRTTLLMGAFAALIGIGCRTHLQNSTAPQRPTRSSVPPRYLIVGQSGATNVTTNHRFVIQELTFVQELFSTLTQSPTNLDHDVLWMELRPFIFVDEHWDVCQGFKSAVGHQAFIFKPYWVERRGDDYVLTKFETGGFTIPFETFQGYLNVFDPAIP